MTDKHKRPARTRQVCVKLSESDWIIVERIARFRAMSIPDVLRAGIDHMTIHEEKP